MLQELNGCIQETATAGAVLTVTGGANGVGQYSNCADYGQYHYQTYWNTYPVYICTDKTAKAIQIVKLMQAEKLIDLKSVPKFIDLVEKIVKAL